MLTTKFIMSLLLAVLSRGDSRPLVELLAHHVGHFGFLGLAEHLLLRLNLLLLIHQSIAALDVLAEVKHLILLDS